MRCLADGLRLPVNGLDYTILGLYFAVVLGIGWAARRTVRTSLDFFLSGRTLPAWVTGLAFVAANLGATEILGMAANGAQYGVPTVHWYWIGAIPAMVFLGLVMMPFYYGSEVRSVPEFLLRRFGPASHLLSSVIFAVASVLIAGVNLYALAIVLRALLGWPQWVAVVVAGFFVLVYITLGGLTSAVYNEVLQFFVILASLIPLTVVGLRRAGGWGGLADAVAERRGDDFLTAWGGTGIGHANPLGANWLTIVLGLGFVLSFGYWTTNFAEVQRALSARDLGAARRTPLIAAFPKLLVPLVVVVPGLIALVVEPTLGRAGSGLDYNDAIPVLMRDLLPNGVLGLAVTGLLAAFMAGMAANVSSFNTVFTSDIWARYVRPDREDAYYLATGRVVTVLGVLAGMGTAFVAASFSNIMNYLQTLFSFFNVPLFCVFVIGMFWRRATAAGGFWGLLSGTLAAMAHYFGLYRQGIVSIPSDQGANFVSAIVAFAVGAVVTVAVSWRTAPRPDAELAGLVHGLRAAGAAGEPAAGEDAWYRRPAVLGWGAVVLAAACYVPFSW
ncbi:sodium:solute symporter family protein [Streptomyces sp. AV19]|uniref:sodium:solute symporter family protein n=1 Tax=Streptomyces sp. AV19 TaxID=2793068 RepID=UPI0018FEEFE1|nr:sodium:solute symporter family protein [Streptomyces sp. AV19]MBH1935390.1 sodium:solute symporter family protein [Streptomyces sp. AV19]MDG4531276.1 sodium:solute symporter family protein [Streptomyces sp. AV19]